MSQPEIFRRCAHCGMSSKPGELFCAQCGNALVTEKSDEAAEPDSLAVANDLPVETPEVSEGDSEAHTPTSADASGQAAVEPVEPVPTPNTITVFPPRRPTIEITKQLAVPAARAALDDKAKRADRPRRVSSVVLNEAAHDTSLRFILVVALLFVVFLVLLLLSKWIV